MIDPIFLRSRNVIQEKVEVMDSTGISGHNMVFFGATVLTKGDADSRRGEQRICWEKFESTLVSASFEDFFLMPDPETDMMKLETKIETAKQKSSQYISHARKEIPLKPWVTRNLLSVLRKETD